MEKIIERTIKAKTKKGTELQVKVAFYPSTNIRSEILLENGKWYYCNLRTANENGVSVPVVNVDAKYLRESGVSIDKKFKDVNIKVEEYKDIISEMKEEMISFLKAESEKVVFERFAFSYHTSHNLYAVRWLECDADTNLKAYNPTIQRIENAMKYLKPEDVTDYQTSFFIGDYSLESEYEISLTDFEKFFAIADERKAEKERIEKEKEAKKQENARKENEALQDAFDNELMIFGDEILSSVNFKLIHTIGATVSEKDNLICIYSTRYTWQFKDAGIEYKDTYAIRDILSEAGFTWNAERKQWQIEYSAENVEKAVAILKKYDTKAEPQKLGLAQCWECGTWNPIKKMTDDVVGYYCGC